MKLIFLGAMAACWGCGSTSSKAEGVQPLDPKVAQYGKTNAEWAGAWVKWLYEWPMTTDCADPITDPTGELCQMFQDGTGPVFFLTGSWGGVSRRDRCKPPAGKALLVPIIVSFQDNGGVPPESLKSDEQLKQSADTIFEASSGTFQLDGTAVEPLDPYGVKSAPYEYTLPPEPNTYSCANGIQGVTGTFKGYTSGYFVLLPPLAPGPHTIAFTAQLLQPGTAPFTLDVKYDPIVVP
jgi:hypothetical protein